MQETLSLKQPGPLILLLHPTGGNVPLTMVRRSA
jgi:hypothetical protein